MSNRYKRGYRCNECKKLTMFSQKELYRAKHITCPSCGSYAMNPSQGARKQEKNIRAMRESAKWLKI